MSSNEVWIYAQRPCQRPLPFLKTETHQVLAESSGWILTINNKQLTVYTLDILAEVELLEDRQEVGHATNQPTSLRLSDQSINALHNLFTDVHLDRVSGTRSTQTGFKIPLGFGQKSLDIYTQTNYDSHETRCMCP